MIANGADPGFELVIQGVLAGPSSHLSSSADNLTSDPSPCAKQSLRFAGAITPRMTLQGRP
ncbi:hypothetical protein GFS31_43370 (plasmid) [Leptolyngbya sp. BL0902]|nr:hypothetical protein GFS31_43370 [Leptolyngbya sp. BL0902]